MAAAHPVPGDHRGCATTKFAAQAASTSLQWYRPAIPSTATQAASPSLMPSRSVTQRDQSCSTSAGLAARAAPVSLEAQCCELCVDSGGAVLCLGMRGRVAGCCATCARRVSSPFRCRGSRHGGGHAAPPALAAPHGARPRLDPHHAGGGRERAHVRVPFPRPSCLTVPMAASAPSWIHSMLEECELIRESCRLCTHSAGI